MLRLSKLTDYATVILSSMAKKSECVFTAFEIAELTRIALPTVSKILKLLVKARVLNSIRGSKGGYLLARPPENITVATVINALEGPIAITECSLSAQSCQQSSECDIRGNWGLINQVINDALEAVTLADMIRPVENLQQELLMPVTNFIRKPA
jgi:FeS assembly SUF system regulator